MPKGFNKTFSEMNPDEKNNISHRKIAVDMFGDYLVKFSKEI